jgi:glycosyltransferase involved in cell wall biosynthesis
MRDEADLVSVVICFLNAERFLEEAIASVYDQEYPHWELLLVDDGSSDESTGIARTWACRDPHRVSYLEHPGHVNLGLSASRNLGIRTARGEFVAFLDADDVWLPKRLTGGVAIMKAHRDVAMVYAKTLYWHSWNAGATGKDRIQPHWFSAGVTVAPPKLLVRHLEYRAALPAPTSLLVRRGACLDVGGFEDEFRLMHEDQVFLAKICLRHPVHVSDECWDLYRQHPDSACAVSDRSAATAQAEQRFEAWLRGYLARQGVSDARVWSALERRRTRRRPVLRRMKAALARVLWRDERRHGAS